MSSMYPFGGAAARSCMRCGNPLGAKESQCARCGTYNPLPQGQQFGMSQQGASGPGWGQQAQQSPQAGNNAAWSGAMGPSNPGWSAPNQSGAWPQQQNNLFGGPSQQSPQQNMFGTQNNGFGAPNQSSINNSFSAFPQNGVPSSPNTFFNATQQQNGFGNGMQQNGFGTDSWQSANSPAKPAWMKDQDDEKPKKKPNKGLVTLIIILVVVMVVGGGIGVYKVFLKPHNTPTASTNTPAVATPTGTPLISETFKNNNAGWDTTAPTGAKITLANNGKLVMESDNKELYDVILPGGKTYDNFRLDVDTGLTHGDAANGYGIFIRGASTQTSDLGLYYRFEVYGDGSFVVWKGMQKADGTPEDPDPLTSAKAGPNKAINAGNQMNHLTIIANGSSFEFMVNGTAITSFTDTSYKSGVIALFVSNTTYSKTTAQATFENLAIFPVK